MNVRFIKENFDRLHIVSIASQLDIDVISLCKWLRENGYIEEIQPIELQFILKNIEKMPIGEIQENLGLSKTQFSQIRQRFNLGNKHKSTSEYSIEEVINKTKWLIEQKLHLNINDLLPTVIRNEHFKNSDLSPILKFAETHKKNDIYFKYFSAVAFLVCKAYPDTFKPFQFPHSKETKLYFTKKTYIKELRWVIKNKLGLDENILSEVSTMNSFLTKKELSLYGLGYNLYKDIFVNKQDLINELQKACKISPKQKFSGRDELLLKLQSFGINTENCYINGCKNKNIQVHHIVPKRVNLTVKFDLDETYNLMPLCKDHHNTADHLNWEEFKKIKEREIWRYHAAQKIIEKHKKHN